MEEEGVRYSYDAAMDDAVTAQIDNCRDTLLASAGPGETAIASFDERLLHLCRRCSACAATTLVASAGSSRRLNNSSFLGAMRFFLAACSAFLLFRTESNFGAFARSTSFQSPMRMS